MGNVSLNVIVTLAGKRQLLSANLSNLRSVIKSLKSEVKLQRQTSADRTDVGEYNISMSISQTSIELRLKQSWKNIVFRK